jgi:hypothetical protein
MKLKVKIYGAHKRHLVTVLLKIIKGGASFFKEGDSFLIQKTDNHYETHMNRKSLQIYLLYASSEWN